MSTATPTQGTYKDETVPAPSLAVSALTLRKQAITLGPITFSVHGPGCWWLAGPSGAGKSLLLESLAGFHSEAAGSICVQSGTERHEAGHLAPEKRSIALMPQRWRLFPHWSVARNLRFAARLGGAPGERVHTLCERLQVAHLLDRPARALSGGETQRIALIQTLLSPASVLLLDEPLSAVGPAVQLVILDLLREEAVARRRIFLIAIHKPIEAHPLQGRFCIEGGRLEEERTIAEKLNW